MEDVYRKGQKWTQILYQKYLGSSEPLVFFRTINPPKGSHLWNFMMQCNPLIHKKLTQDIGNGKWALFWEDSWDGQHSLETSNIPPNIKNTLTTLWGNKVSDYKYYDRDEWKWKSVELTNLTIQEKTLYTKYITQSKHLERQDKVV